ncbi:MFS transporter [Paucibacter sp. O1-1]|nr:MFS transporter [Paucibacter sp. O1-1]MDA3827719.1 MFS transporter [Paucibacter sp. O1-1]
MIAFRALCSAKPIFYTSISGTLSRLATYAFLAAVSFHVLEVTGRADILALTLLSGTLPIVLIGFISGHIVDKFDRAFIIFASIVARFAAVLALFFCLMKAGAASFVILISIGCAVISVTDSITAIAFNSLIPQHADKDKLDKINVASTSLMELSRISGPFIGTLVFQTFGFKAVLLVCIGIYAISAFPTFLILGKAPSHLNNDKLTTNDSVLSIFSRVLSDSRLVSLLLNGFLTHVSLFPFLMIGLPFLIVKVFNGQPAEFGLIEFAAAVGTASSGLLIARFGNRSLGVKLLHSLILLALAFTLYALLFNSSVFQLLSSSATARVAALGAGSLLIFACYGLYASFFGAIIQSSIAIEQLGRVFSLVIVANALGRFFGFLMFGFLFEHNWKFAVVAFITISWLKIAIHLPFMTAVRASQRQSEIADAGLSRRTESIQG